MRRVRPSSASLALSVAAATVGASLLGCAAHGPMSAQQAKPAVSSSARADKAALPSASAASLHDAVTEHFEAGGRERVKAAQALSQLDEAVEEGQAALLAGDEDKAFDAFDRALDGVLTANVDLDSEPELKARVEGALAEIQGLAVKAAEADDEVGEEAPGIPLLRGAQAADEVAAASFRIEGGLTVPLVTHPAVDALIRFYTGRAKDRFELGLQRYGKFAPTVARIFADEGIPPEMAWLALVESNYNPLAHSRAHAKGLWQFIPATGRRYGLDQTFWVDERSDFEKATRSAARYLRDLHDMFGDWHLALAAYNAGEGKIGRAIRSTGKADFWRIRETRYIRRETKDYVPAFLAVLTIVRDPAAYGVSFQPSAPLSWETATIRSCTSLSAIATCAGTTPDVIAELNPELRRDATPGGDRPYSLRIPAGVKETFEAKYAALPPEQRLTMQRHVVRRGETLNTIAGAFGTSVGAIMAANGLSNPHHVGVGWDLLIPVGVGEGVVRSSGVVARRGGDSDDSPSPRSTTRRTYRVRPGDTLTTIAARSGTSVGRLTELNGLGNAHRIQVGQRLTILSTRTPSSSSRPATTSSSSTTSSGDRVHVVRGGETLSGIARTNGVSLDTLRQRNGLSSSAVIRPGQRLVVRGGTKNAANQVRTHTVKKGDTLSEIARLYSTSVDKLRTWNDIHRAEPIKPGDRITIRD